MKNNNSVKRIVEFQQQIQERKDKITEFLENSDVKEGRKTLQTLEEEVQRLHNEISDLQMAIVLQELIGNAESQQSIAKMIKGLHSSLQFFFVDKLKT